MAQYYSTVYQYPANSTWTTGKENTRNQHIDLRIDALEGHMADVLSNPHNIVTVTGAIRFSFGWFEAGTVGTGNIGAHPSAPIALTIASVKAYANTPSSSGAITVDILKSSDNGTTWATIFSTKLTIDEGERDSATAAVAAVLSVTTLAAGDRVKANVDAAGSAAADITVELHCSYTATMTGAG